MVSKELAGKLQKYSRIIAIIILSVFLIWIVFNRTDSKQNFWISSFMVALTLSFAMLMSFWTYVQLNRWTRPQTNGVSRQTISIEMIRLRKVWLYISMGLLLWLAGCLARVGFRIVNFNTPLSLTLLDGFYLIGSVFLWIALFTYPRRPRIEEGRLGLLLDSFVVTTVVFVLIWIIAIEPVLMQFGGDIRNLITVLYPLTDMISLLVLVNLFLLTSPRFLPTSFFWISTGMIFFTMSDLGYAAGLLIGSYFPGNLIDYGWVLGAMVFALVAIGQIARYPRQDFRIRTQSMERLIHRFQRFLPLILLLAMGAYTIYNWFVFAGLNTLAIWILIILSLFLAARQGILAGEIEMRQYASLVNSVAEPAFVCDTHGLLRLVNPAFVQAVGVYHSVNLLGRSLNELFVPEEEVKNMFKKGLEGGSSGELFLKRIEKSLFLEDQEEEESLIPIFLSLRPLLQAGSERLVLAGTAHDLTIQKQQQQALLAANEQIKADREELSVLNNQLEILVEEKTADLTRAYHKLEEQNTTLKELDQLKSDFVSLVSHELRAPLTTINGGIELILTGKNQLSGHTRDNLQLVQTEILRLNRFVETILDLSALEAGKMPVYLAPVSLKSMINQMGSFIRSYKEKVIWNIPEDFPPILVDEQALTSVIFHLLDNASKYAPQGNIFVSAGVEGEKAWIEVADQGPGIPEDRIHLLFERFQRLENRDSRQIYGHGLGLYIVRRLLEAMQGEVTVQNREEGGTAFTCWVNLAETGVSDDDN